MKQVKSNHICNKISKASRALLLATITLTVFPQYAHANAGTPLMWAGMLHLIIGNALIGIIEGLLISKVFSVRKRRSIPIMILANYVSMIAGSLIIGAIGNFFNHHATIYSIHALLFSFLLFSFMITILIEWPFCVWILKFNNEMRKKSLKASVYAQILSYALIIPFYFLASGTSLLWNVKLDRSLSFVKSDPWIYYISTDNNKILRSKVTGGHPEKVLQTKTNSEYARLFSKPSNDTGQWDLWIKDRAENKQDEARLLLKNFTNRAEPLRRWDGKTYEDEEPDSWFNFGVMDFRNLDKRDWEPRTGFWAVEGFHAENKRTGQKIYIALETPFIQWYMRNVSILPDDQVIFQIGDQIVIFDLNSRKMGLITKGRGPILTFE